MGRTRSRAVLATLLLILGVAAVLTLLQRTGEDRSSPDPVAGEAPARSDPAPAGPQLEARQVGDDREPARTGSNDPPPPVAAPPGSEPSGPPSPAAAPDTSGEIDPAAAPDPSFPATRDGIREAMGFKKYDVQECYEAWLRTQPELGGLVVISMTLVDGEPGLARVEDVHLVESTLQNTALEGCIVNAVSSLRFESPPDGRLRITYPFRLSPAAPGTGPDRAR